MEEPASDFFVAGGTLAGGGELSGAELFGAGGGGALDAGFDATAAAAATKLLGAAVTGGLEARAGAGAAIRPLDGPAGGVTELGATELGGGVFETRSASSLRLGRG